MFELTYYPVVAMNVQKQVLDGVIEPILHQQEKAGSLWYCTSGLASDLSDQKLFEAMIQCFPSDEPEYIFHLFGIQN